MQNVGKVSQLCELETLDVWLLYVACLQLDLKHEELSQSNGSFLPRGKRVGQGADLGVISQLKGAALTRCKACQGRKGKLVTCGVLSVGPGSPERSLRVESPEVWGAGGDRLSRQIHQPSNVWRLEGIVSLRKKG